MCCGKWENLDVGRTWSAMASRTFSLSQEGRHDVQSACPVRIWNLLPPIQLPSFQWGIKKKLLVAWKTLENHWPSWFSLFLHYFKLTFGAHVVVQTPGIGNSHQPPGWLIFGTGKMWENPWEHLGPSKVEHLHMQLDSSKSYNRTVTNLKIISTNQKVSDVPLS